VNNGGCSIYYNSRFIYIYNKYDKITIGVSINDILYIGLDVKDFILSLNKECNNLICNDLKNIDENSYFLIKDNIKCVAYLNYLKNNDIY
jgi:hypothetical protein